MMTNEIVEKVQELIQRDGLSRKTRKREIVYKRAYLMHVLRCQELTFKAIGKIFNKEHATVIFHCNMVDHYLNKTRDDIFINIVQEYLQVFEGTKYLPEHWDLEYDVMNCNSTYELKLIKERILEKKYQTNATILE